MCMTLLDAYLLSHAGPPSRPLPNITYNDGGLSITVAWDEPFTHTGFGINYYVIQIINITQSLQETQTVFMGLRRMYTANVTTLPTTCHELEYIVTAYNDVGSSAGSVRGGFPISE